MQPGVAMPSSVSVATAEIVAQQSQDYVDEQLAEYQGQIQKLQGRTIGWAGGTYWFGNFGGGDFW